MTLDILLSSIRAAEKKYHRAPHAVSLLAVSKNQSADKIRALYSQDQKAFGENYLQEALEKQNLLSDLTIEWHFIGHIQSNKTKQIAENFSWVHSVDRIDIAKRLNDQRPAHLPPLNICIEINIDQENNKSGIAPKDLLPLAKAVSTLCNIRLRGLMVIPKIDSHDAFQKTAALQQTLIDAGFMVDTLSMGMSSDYEAAIAAGATVVRVGTALFGNR
jgi:pyridoxal phosphate enzyme (YggS family)